MPLCEALSSRRGRGPHHAHKDRVGTWDISLQYIARVGDQAVLKSGPSSKTCFGRPASRSVSFPQSMWCSFGCGEPCKNARDSVTMAPKFTPDEEAEIELMLWE